jgi:hypothetical protein
LKEFASAGKSVSRSVTFVTPEYWMVVGKTQTRARHDDLADIDRILRGILRILGVLSVGGSCGRQHADTGDTGQNQAAEVPTGKTFRHRGPRIENL